MPTDSISPIIATRLSEVPRKYSAARVIIRLNGMARLMSRVIRHSRKNTYSTSTLSSAPSIRLWPRLSVASAICSPWSKKVKNADPCARGSTASSASAFWICAPTSTVFALDSLRTPNAAERLPSTRSMSASAVLR